MERSGASSAAVRRGVRVGVWLLGAVSAVVAVQLDGWIRAAAVAGLLVWLVTDATLDAREQGWRWSLATHGIGMLFVASFLASLADRFWLNVVGWAGLFLAVFFLGALGWQRSHRTPSTS